MRASAAVLTVPIPEGKPASLPDFGDRLSPMLVKELRQGMRSPLFVWGLISMNLFLAGVVWLTMDNPDENTLHQAFFGGYCALVCGLLPLRAAGALHDELRGNTIDTLILTRLTGWRITLGKWVAVVAQQCLATVTVLPYLIVRYFAGGVDVPMELAWLGIFLLTGMASAAVLTGFSWLKYFLFRAAIMMGMTFLTGAFCVAVLEDMFDYEREYIIDELYRDGGWQIFALFLVPGLHMAFFALDLGASKVGSVVENRSIRRRLAGFVVLAFYGVMAAFWSASTSHGMGNDAVGITLGLIATTLLVLGLQAILELPLHLTAVVMPMVKRGFWGKAAGRFFYPGWPSGVCYTFFLLLCLGGATAVYVFQQDWLDPGKASYRFSERNAAEMTAAAGATFGMLPVPLVLWQLFLRRRLPWHFGIYTLLMAAVCSLAIGIMVAAASTNSNVLKLGLPIPLMGLSWTAQSYERHSAWEESSMEQYLSWDYRQVSIFTGAASTIWWLLAVLVAQRAFRETRAVEREADLLLQAGRDQLVR